VAIIVAIFSQTHLVTLLAIVTRSYFCNAWNEFAWHAGELCIVMYEGELLFICT
jgi:hypothetical protein